MTSSKEISLAISYYEMEMIWVISSHFSVLANEIFEKEISSWTWLMCLLLLCLSRKEMNEVEEDTPSPIEMNTFEPEEKSAVEYRILFRRLQNYYPRLDIPTFDENTPIEELRYQYEIVLHIIEEENRKIEKKASVAILFAIIESMIAMGALSTQ